MLFDTGMITRMGRTDQGNTVTDFDPEETKRQITINTGVAHCKYNDILINILDAPGYADFIGDMKCAMKVADTACIVVCGVSGVEVQTEKAWEFSLEENLPVVFFINKLDRENSNFFNVLSQINEYMTPKAVPVAIPVGSEHNFKGIVSLLNGKAYIYKGDGSKDYEETDIPPEVKDQYEEYREKLIESIVEVDEEVMMKYLEGEEITEEELIKCLKQAILNRELFPVFPGSATSNIGVIQFIDFIAKYLPSPLDMPPKKAIDKDGNEVEVKPDPEGTFMALVFKIMVDPYVGKMTYLRVFSGKLTSDQSIYNVNKQEEERIATFKRMLGKEGEDIKEIVTGDIVAIPKLQSTAVGDTLSVKGTTVMFPPIEFPEPVYSLAVEPKTRSDEDKLSNALHKMLEEDPTISYKKDPDTGDNILSGMGDLHLDIMISRLKERYGVELDTRTPKVPYRETIKKVSKAQGKYKKQTGGRGQYGDVWMEFQPLPRGSGVQFEERIVGGVVPKQYIPAVEKGLREAAQKGVLAGYPTVDFKAILYDGSYHEVDSSEMAFKIAASLSFKKGISEANPVLLEPIMSVEVIVPEEYTGDIMGDLNSRRGRILGMDSKGRKQIIKAQVPLSEMFRYAIALRSMTSGRGTFTMKFSHYEEVPPDLAKKIIAQAQKEAEEDKK